jgi:adenylate kinase
MIIVLLGPQGAGKGTQSTRLAEKLDIPAIATGEMFRWAISHDTDVGHKAQQYVRAGRLVPDDLTTEIVQHRLDAEIEKESFSGFLLDGYPRNIVQADAFGSYLSERDMQLDAALVIEVPEDVSLRRLLGRRVCSQCGRNYHDDDPPAEDWTCDRCGGAVEKRFDDEDENTIRERLALYHDQTVPLKAYYRQMGLLREIDGEGPPDEVFDRIVASF